MNPSTARLGHVIDLLSEAHKPSPTGKHNRVKDSLKALRACRLRIDDAAIGLNAANSGLGLVLRLLEESHDEALSADQVHCLLEPLQGRLVESLTKLDEVL